MSKRKLLLADDSVTIQKVVNLTFADEGIEVITVGDGDSALEKISQVHPDLILADVHMPGLSGYQICEIVRENPATKDLPVVLLVGSFEPFDENEATRVGANAFLTKPFQSIRQLVSQVSDLMERSAPAPAPAPLDDDDGDLAFDDTDENLLNAAAAADQQVAIGEETEKVPDTNDIESLYRQSVGSSDAAYGQTSSLQHVDRGMDDEMIETRYVGEEETPADVAELEDIGASGLDESASYVDGGDDTHEVSLAAGESEIEGVEESGFEMSQAEPEGETEWLSQSPFDTVATADDGVLTAEEPSQSAAYFDQPSDTDDFSAEDTLSRDEEFSLDEIDLLELPPVQDATALELTTKEDMVQQGQNKQVMSLSPELMEMIVQKVVERLSQK